MGDVMNGDYDRSIAIETEAAKAVLYIIADDDPDLVAGMVEGETGLIDAVQKAVDAIDECDVFSTGLAAKIAEFNRRKSAVEARQKRLRAAIEQAMVVLSMDQIRLPTATISLRKRPPALVITEEADIPAKFWTAGAPKLDKRALLEALKQKATITGASLDNGGVSMSLRRS